jgi:tRNA(Arg) A34 adenosine deaminase TadA
MSDVFKRERDTIAGLGLLASNYVRFDPELVTSMAISHSHGFNVHCLIVDNVDGEVLSLARNKIHADDNPLQHGEQVAIRTALTRLHAKRPRPVALSVEKYYKGSLFMAPGVNPEDFVNVGCTLYNTFDPCGMCATTLLVCYMKRIVYLFEDSKFEAVYEEMRKYFGKRESVKEPLMLVGESDPSALGKAAKLIGQLREKIKAMEAGGRPLVLTLDLCHDDLRQAAELLIATDESQLVTTGPDRIRNARTLQDIKRLCNIN